MLALANDVGIGEPIRPQDLTEVYISTDVPSNVQDVAGRASFLGALPVADLSAGTLINKDMFLVGSTLGEGQAFVGLVLDGNRAPIGLNTGDRVQVLSLADKDSPEILSADARVENADYTSSNLSIRLRMGLIEAQGIQINSQNVVLIEISNDGLASWEIEGPS